MKLGKILLATAIFFAGAQAADFVGYKGLTKKLKKESKANGSFASVEDVKKALKAKDWVVADVRTMEEFQAARIKGSVRIGRQNPEKALADHVLDVEDNFVKNNLMIVCNTASRASIEAVTLKQLGFKDVKIFGINKWIDECQPFTSMYSNAKDKSGRKAKFGEFKAAHCYK